MGLQYNKERLATEDRSAVALVFGEKDKLSRLGGVKKRANKEISTPTGEKNRSRKILNAGTIF